jgi:CDP-diacylglycerol--glycerol-3-phosphate 3-phosphatidyltransferase
MISVYKIKPAFQKLLQPVLNSLHRLGVTANQITSVAIILSLFTGILIWQYPDKLILLLIPLALLIRMALNALDGMMARQFNMQSRIGEILNEAGDVISDLFIYFPLIKIFPANTYLFLSFLFLSVINEFAGVLGKAITGIRFYDGPMGKSDRAFFISILCLLFYFYPQASNYCDYYFSGAIALLLISTGIRFYKSATK